MSRESGAKRAVLRTSTEGLTTQHRQTCALLLTRPGWHGEYHPGHRKCVRAVKRREAMKRDEKTRLERRRWVRLAEEAWGE